MKSQIVVSWLALALSACGTGAAGKSEDPQAVASTAAAGFSRTPEGWLFRTSELGVGPGEERYMCYVASAPEDLSVTAFATAKTPFVHHFLLIEPQAPEPDGARECDVLLQLTWAPLFAATTGESELLVPEGAAKTIKKGSQILLQVHLQNSTETDAHQAVEVKLDTVAPSAATKEVGITLFGATDVHLPPHQTTIVENTCVADADLDLYAALPHMHQTGRRLVLDARRRGGAFETIFRRDPFEFGDQRLDAFTHTIEKGTEVRIRCTYQNESDRQIDFGESATDEMCYVVGFTVGGPPFEFCSLRKPSPEDMSPRDAEAGACVRRESGIGQLCRRNTHECGGNLFCSADLLGSDQGLCFSIGCQTSSSCGAGNTCCMLPYIGDIASVCLPEACRPEGCIPVDAPSAVR